MGPHLTPSQEKALIAHTDEYGFGSVIVGMCKAFAMLLGGVAAFVTLLLLLSGCGTDQYSTPEPADGDVVVMPEDPAGELAAWGEDLCRLAHERAWFEVGRSEQVVNVGRGGADVAEFHSATVANQLGVDFAVEVSLPWTPHYGGYAGHYDYVHARTPEHSSGRYVSPSWVNDGSERQAVTDWFVRNCSMSDPYAELAMHYTANPNWDAAAAEELIKHQGLLTPVAEELPEWKDRHPARKRCSGGPCPAGTIFQ